MSIAKSDFFLGMLTGAGIFGLGMFLGGGSAQTQPTRTNAEQVIQANRFEVVDELGTVLMVLGSNEEGGAISVRDRLGRTLVLASAAEHGGALVVSNTVASKPAFVARAIEAGGAMQVLNTQGKSICDLAAKPGGALVNISDDSGRAAIMFRSAGDDGGAMTMFGNDGATAMRMFSNVAGSGVIETYRNNGQPLVSLSSTEGGHGQINAFASYSKPLVTITATANHEGHIYTYDGEGHTMIALASSPTGPTLRMFNRHGEPVATLESDAQGNGVLGAWKRDGSGKLLTP